MGCNSSAPGDNAELDEQVYRDIMAEADAGKDGCIDFVEFVNMMKKLVSPLSALRNCRQMDQDKILVPQLR